MVKKKLSERECRRLRSLIDLDLKNVSKGVEDRRIRKQIIALKRKSIENISEVKCA